MDWIPRNWAPKFSLRCLHGPRLRPDLQFFASQVWDADVESIQRQLRQSNFPYGPQSLQKRTAIFAQSDLTIGQSSASTTLLPCTRIGQGFSINLER